MHGNIIFSLLTLAWGVNGTINAAQLEPRAIVAVPEESSANVCVLSLVGVISVPPCHLSAWKVARVCNDGCRAITGRRSSPVPLISPHTCTATAAEVERNWGSRALLW